jgi:DNA-binding MarR family transcriptional regulator
VQRKHRNQAKPLPRPNAAAFFASVQRNPRVPALSRGAVHAIGGLPDDLSSTMLVNVNTSLPDGDVAALELMTRALVGLTMRSLDVLEGAVTVPQFRLLLVLDELGQVPSSRLAAKLGTLASSVTRLADRLETSGLLVRGHVPGNRSIVTVEVTPAGRDLVARVVARRHLLLAEVLDRMTPAERASAARAARRFAELAADAGKAVAVGPLPL